MTTVYTRATKGSALTWTEGDANITNLNNDKIEAVVDDTAPQLGGNLDVNGNSIVSTSNANINIEPNGTGKVVTTKTLNAAILASTQSSGDEGGQIELALAATNNSLSGSVAIDINQSQLRIFETGGSNRGAYINLTEAATGVGTNLLAGGGATTLDGLSDVVITTPATGEILIYNGTNWINGDAGIDLTDLSVGAEGTASGDGAISYDNTTGVFTYTPPTASGIGALANVVEDTTPQLGGNLDVQANIITTSTTNGNITITPDGTGDVILSTDSVQIGEGGITARLTTQGGQLLLNANNGTNSGNITISANANGNITLAPHGTGKSAINALNYNEGAIYDLGTTGGTIAPNITNGNVQKITLNSALTMNGFTSPVAGQSLTLIIYGGTAYTSITSTMKFAGGIKTLTGTAGCIDILSVYYDGTTYFASLGKGFA